MEAPLSKPFREEDLSPEENSILEMLYHHIVERDNASIDMPLLLKKLPTDVKVEDFLAKLLILSDADYVESQRFIIGDTIFTNVTYASLEIFANQYYGDFDKITKKVVAQIINNNINSNFDLKKELNIPLIFINFALDILQDDNMLNYTRTLSGRIAFAVNPLLKRKMMGKY